MHRSEVQFCRDEADRLLKLGDETTDPRLRDELRAMASEWIERARAKEPPAGSGSPAPADPPV
jgi:hypothetical protein